MSDLEKSTQQEIAPEVEKNQSSAPVDNNKKGGNFFRLASTRKIVFIATFVALSVAVKFLTVPLVGGQISFFYLPVWLSSIFFGPAVGFCVGAIGDILGAIIRGYGTVIPLVTLGNAMNGLIMGAFFALPKLVQKRSLNAFLKILLGTITCLIIVTLGINSFGLAQFYGINYWQYLVVPAPPMVLPRIIFQPIILAINFALLFPLYYGLDKLLPKLLNQKIN